MRRAGPIRLSLEGPGPVVCAPGLPDCWGSRPGVLGLGHHDGALFLHPDHALWAPLDGLVSLDGGGAAWTALSEAEDGSGTAWELTADGWSPRAHLPSGLDGVRLEGGALVERGGARRRVVRLAPPPRPVSLPMGAERGRLAVSSAGVAWADGPDLYWRATDARARSLGAAPGPVTRLQCTSTGDVLATIGDEATLVRARSGRARLLPHASEEPAVLGPDGALLQVDEDVLELTWRDAEPRWHRSRQLCGSTTALLVPDEACVCTLDGTVLWAGLWPAAAAATRDSILGPGGRAWCRRSGSPGALQRELLAEHLVAHEGHVFAVLDGEASVRDEQGCWTSSRPLPVPFLDPDALHEVRPSRGGVVLVGEGERVHVSWSGQVRRGFLPPSRPAPAPPAGWHWNDAGLLLRLG